ncbi:MAG: RNA 2',3'-cyclic phosphodiesterase [Bacillota bacterium]
MRLFFAIRLTSSVIGRLAALQKQLKSFDTNVKWVEEHNLHVTIKFLGETPRDKIILLKEIGTTVARHTKPFQMQIEKVGAFPNIKSPKVIYVAITHGLNEIKKLNETITCQLVKKQFSFDLKSFHPHITLGRVKKPLLDPETLFSTINKENQISIIQPANSICLFESLLIPYKPPKYNLVFELPFLSTLENHQLS